MAKIATIIRIGAEPPMPCANITCQCGHLLSTFANLAKTLLCERLGSRLLSQRLPSVRHLHPDDRALADTPLTSHCTSQ